MNNVSASTKEVEGMSAEPTRIALSEFSLRAHRASAEEREGICIF